MKTKNTYQLPCNKEDIQKALSDSRAHSGRLKYSIDFSLNEGSKIFASQSGKIIATKNDSNEGGFTKKYRESNPKRYMNYITIKHRNGEISEYGHLKHRSVKVKKGDEVEQGDLIALSGNTGISTTPHLHFHVLHVIKDSDWKTLEIKWQKPPEIEIKDMEDWKVKYFKF